MIIHICMTLILTGTGIMIVLRKKERLLYEAFHSHVVLMIVSGLASAMMGVHLGVFTQTDMGLAGALAMIYGVIIGALTATPFAPIFRLSSMFEGAMGGLMGAMTGIMMNANLSMHLLALVLYGLFGMVCLMISHQNGFVAHQEIEESEKKTI